MAALLAAKATARNKPAVRARLIAKSGPSQTKIINKIRYLQQSLFEAGGAEYRAGDKVIQLRNNYDKGLFNGDIGTVVAVDAAKSALEWRA